MNIKKERFDQSDEATRNIDPHLKQADWNFDIDAVDEAHLVDMFGESQSPSPSQEVSGGRLNPLPSGSQSVSAPPVGPVASGSNTSGELSTEVLKDAGMAREAGESTGV